MRALEAGKHVFVEKPLAMSGSDARALASVAVSERLLLMVGHVLLFHPAVLKLKELVETGELGRVFYLYGNRQNLGKVRRDENALWSLAPHDISVLLYLLDDRPTEVSARGDSYLRTGIADVVFCYLRFESGISAHLHLSWLDPQKLRRLTVVGSERMAVFDDMETDRKLMVYEKAAVPAPTASTSRPGRATFSAPGLLLRSRSGWSASTSSRRWPWAVTSPFGTPAAVDVVEVLEALQRSLDLGGAAVTLKPARPRIFRCFSPAKELSSPR